ncbi:FKBP-type peptidyl-prolyl cis-trans isomerase [Massilia antarctica]|uniref:Peptidyl-prolyl cis-trans isomerase n=1 Tax=Massilia antarctica TaxID=2765360 RepID=A0AA48WGW1_9BURK|nr:FKBP-type peptidyl-prolyl cis-trans isomerase [Massilia antarctica]QPI51538.1 FKBP-type peptidyl-prolyl cis-trans isomerase [Massilia antarctica]
MKLKLTLTAAFVATLALAACGSSDDSPVQVPPITVVTNPATLVSKDTVVGTGAEAAVGKKISVNYAGYLYDSSKPDNKGANFETSKEPVEFPLASGSLIEGWVQGIPGMKVGGKRTLSIPSSLAYGANGKGVIPANAGLVFDIELVGVK